MQTLSERMRLGLMCLLLLVMLGILAFTATNTFEAVRNFQQEYSAVRTGDVRAIDPWMTLHTISHIYHVPEDYLYSTLHLGAPGSLRHASLYDLARRKRQSVNDVIHAIQHAILTYRKQHLLVPTPVPTLRAAGAIHCAPTGTAMLRNEGAINGVPTGTTMLRAAGVMNCAPTTPMVRRK